MAGIGRLLKKHSKLVTAIAAILAVYALYQLNYPSGVLRYKLNITFLIDDKLVTKSAVQELIVSKNPAWFSNSGSNLTSSVRGEAVIASLPEIGKVFAVMRVNLANAGKSYRHMVPISCEIAKNFPERGRQFVFNRINFKGTCVVSEDWYPMFVYFQDIADPKSVTSLTPDEMRILSNGRVSIEKVTIETTDLEAQDAIRDELPWIDEEAGGFLGGRYSDGNRYSLRVADFISPER